MSKNDQLDGTKEPSTPMPIVAVVVAVAVSVAVAGGLKAYFAKQTKDATTQNWGLDQKNTDRLYGLIQSEMTPLLEGSAFRAYVEREITAKKKTDPHVDERDFGYALGRALVARGIPRLPDDALATLQQLKTKMAFVSDRACPCYWDVGSCTEADIFDGLAKLSDDDLATWFRLSARAAQLEMGVTELVPDTTKDFKEGLVVILKALPESDRLNFIDMLQATGGMSKPDQCFAMKTVFQGSETLPPEMKARFVRALSNLGAKAP